MKRIYLTLLILLTSCSPVILRQTDGRMIGVKHYERGPLGSGSRPERVAPAEPFRCGDFLWCNK